MNNNIEERKWTHEVKECRMTSSLMSKLRIWSFFYSFIACVSESFSFMLDMLLYSWKQRTSNAIFPLKVQIFFRSLSFLPVLLTLTGKYEKGKMDFYIIVWRLRLFCVTMTMFLFYKLQNVSNKSWCSREVSNTVKKINKFY